MSEPSPLSLIVDRQNRLEAQQGEQGKEIDEIRDALVEVPVMKRAFYWVAVVLTGAIVAVIGSAVAIILSNGGPR